MGWLVWGQMPEIWTHVGATIVIGSALYIASARRSFHESAASPQAPDDDSQISLLSAS
jgi:drug/metabolite transporter (DMT)-like permease